MLYLTTGYVVLLIFLASLLPGQAYPQEGPACCPVAANRHAGGGTITCYLLGGWSTDGWLLDKAAARLLQGGETYRFYNLSGELGESSGNLPGPFAPEGDPCHETQAVSFANSPPSKDGLVAVGSQVKALPRVPRLLSPDQKIYQKATAAILRQQGITRPKVKISQVISVDLDGDGSEEVLVSATHYAQGLSSRASSGDYSVVFLRKMVHDKVVTTIVAGDFFPKSVEFGAPSEHRLAAVLDLNGDGIMEIVLFGRYYEGDWVAAYKAEGSEVTKIFSAGCGF
jgi:hypothetical protein